MTANCCPFPCALLMRRFKQSFSPFPLAISPTISPPPSPPSARSCSDLFPLLTGWSYATFCLAAPFHTRCLSFALFVVSVSSVFCLKSGHPPSSLPRHFLLVKEMSKGSLFFRFISFPASPSFFLVSSPLFPVHARSIDDVTLFRNFYRLAESALFLLWFVNFQSARSVQTLICGGFCLVCGHTLYEVYPCLLVARSS